MFQSARPSRRNKYCGPDKIRGYEELCALSIGFDPTPHCQKCEITIAHLHYSKPRFGNFLSTYMKDAFQMSYMYCFNSVDQ